MFMCNFVLIPCQLNSTTARLLVFMTERNRRFKNFRLLVLLVYEELNDQRERSIRTSYIYFYEYGSWWVWTLSLMDLKKLRALESLSCFAPAHSKLGILLSNDLMHLLIFSLVQLFFYRFGNYKICMNCI